MSLFNNFRLVIVALVIPVGLLYLALEEYDEQIHRRATADLTHAVRGETPFQWGFDPAGEIYPLRKHNDLDGLRFHEGLLRANSGDGNPFLYLELAGRLIDARRYHRLEMRLYSDQPSKAQLFFNLPDDKSIAVGPRIAVTKGWQEIALDLNNLRWRYMRYTGEGRDYSNPEKIRWGGEAQVVEKLRLDPLVKPEIDFAIDWIRLLPSRPMPGRKAAPSIIKAVMGEESLTDVEETLVVWKLIPQANDRQWIEEWIGLHRDEFLVIEDGGWLRTPELANSLRREIQQLAPAAVYFPRPVSKDELKALIENAIQEPDKVPVKWMPLPEHLAVASVFAMLGFAGFAAFVPAYRNRMSPRARAMGELALVGIMVMALAKLLPGNNDLLGYGLGVSFLLLCVALSRGWLTPRTEFDLGSRDVWRATAWLSLPPLLLIFAVAASGDALAKPEPEALLRGLLVYPLWALLQQFLVCSVVVRRIETLTDNASLTTLFGAGFFSLLHFPNFALMMSTYIMGIAWITVYRRYRTLIPIAVSHGVLATLFRELAPESIRLSGDFGANYYAWLGVAY